MWILVRSIALAVLAAVAVLVAGQGSWLLDLADLAAEVAGIGPLRRDTAALTPTVVVGGLAVGTAAAVLRPSRRAPRQIVTLLHELGHTLAAAAFGARPAGIVLRHDASGHATARWYGRPGPVRRVSLAVTAFVGLPAPAVAAAAGAGLLTSAGPRAVAWSVVAAAAAVGVLARSLWSLLVAAGLGGLAVAALAEPLEPWAAGAVVALLAATAVSAATGAVRRLSLPIVEGDDARTVRRNLPVPPRLVLGAQVAATVAAAACVLWRLLAAITTAA